ncbi:MAG: FG-GAP-like repeat-containing protein [Rhodothermales bacterium]
MEGVNFPLWASMAVLVVLGQAAQAQAFEQVTLGALGSVESASASVTWADYDGDGDLDVFVTNPFFTNLLYRNEGNGGFTIVEALLGHNANQYSSVWGDFDNDGDPDLFIGSLSFGQLIYRNHPEGFSVFGGVEVSDVRDIDLADFDRDGDLDIALARRFGVPDLLARNEGGFVFTVLNDALPGSSDDGATPAWGDYDNDGDPDLFVANSLDGSGRNVLYENTGESFVQVAGPYATIPGRWQSANWVDIDNDLDLDLFVSNFSGNNALYRNTGESFIALVDNVVSNDGLPSIGSNWADIDNDGDQDLVLAVENGAERLYINDGAGSFTEQILGGDDGDNSMGVVISDFDDDGRLDIVVANGARVAEAQLNRVYHNVSDGGNWLKIQPVGVLSNRAGIGAHIKVKATIDGEPRWQLRPMQSKPGRFAQSGPWVHFGLGDATTVDSVVVEWPSGIEQSLGSVSVNQTLTISEEGTVSSEADTAVPEPFGISEVYPNPTSQGATFVLSADRSETVRVDVFDSVGRRVRTLLNGSVQQGRLQLAWDGRSSGGRDVAAGTYIVRMKAGVRSDVARVTLLR